MRARGLAALTVGLVLWIPFLHAGDGFWTEIPGMADAWEMVVCDGTVWAATGAGLFRSQDLPASWCLVKEGTFMAVACDGDTVLALQSAIPDVPWVSHDGGTTWAEITGLANEDIRGFAVSGTMALAAVRNGVLVSTNGGDSFSVYAILWSSSNEWNILDVWTDGTQCVAVGEYSSGIWYSSTCQADSFSVVVSASLEWLTASGSTIVAGDRYGGTSNDAYISRDGGVSWSQLPWSWSGITARYNLPFVSGERIMGSRADSVWDGSQFVPVHEGPHLYDMATGTDFGNDLGAGGFPHDAQVRAMAIVEGTEPILLAGVAGGPVYWYRFANGWPTEPVDLTPPGPGTVDCPTRLATTSGLPSTVSLALTNPDATRMALLESVVSIDGGIRWDGSQYLWSATVDSADLTDSGWVAFATTYSWTPGSGTGIHFFDAWFADDAGNTTNPSAFSALTVLPGTVSLTPDTGWWTYAWLEAGETVSLGVTASGGDADVYHWEPGSTGSADDSAETWNNDTLTFTARATGLHILLVLNYPGSGSIVGGTVTVSVSRDGTVPASRGDGSRPPGGQAQPPGSRTGSRDFLPSSERDADVNGDGRLDAADIEAILTNIWNGATGLDADCSGDGNPDARDLACTIPRILYR